MARTVASFAVLSLFCAVSCVAVAGGEGGVVAVGRPPRRKGRSNTTGAVVEDIERRVVAAGGNVEGVIVASLSWFTPDDLDLHIVTPDGDEINFQRRKAAGGELDVDMCVHGRPHGKARGTCTEQPVENIVFSDDAPQGRFKVYVQNFNFHPNFLPEDLQVARMHGGGKQASIEEKKLRLGNDRPVLFELVVKVEGTVHLFRGLCTPVAKMHSPSDVRVFEFDYFPNAETGEDRFAPVFQADADSSCAAFEQKLLEAQGDQGSLESGREARAALSKDSSRQPQRTSGQKPARPRDKPKSKRAQALEETKRAALQTVLASSRDILLSKPAKALWELLKDLGTACKGCLEKADIVDRLQHVAGVGRPSAEL